MGYVTFNSEALFDDVWTQWVGTGGVALEAAAKADVGVKTGELRDSISFRSTSNRSGELRATAPHAIVHHQGHGEILPKDPDGVLAWMGRFAKSVGPVAGNPFLLDAARQIGLKVR